jgi:exodeoxyribonuclease VII small subunit
MTKKKQSFEENMRQTNEIIAQLEQGELPLEAAMDAYKQGVALVHAAHVSLVDAEKEFAALLQELEQLDDERQQ